MSRRWLRWRRWPTSCSPRGPPPLAPRLLPHTFPFRLIDRRDGDAARVALTAGAFWARGGERALPEIFLVEVLAQAAALVFAESGGPSGRGYLAGVENLQVERLPQPGDQLIIEVQRLAVFGRLVKVAAQATCGDDEIARCELLLATA